MTTLPRIMCRDQPVQGRQRDRAEKDWGKALGEISLLLKKSKKRKLSVFFCSMLLCLDVMPGTTAAILWLQGEVIEEQNGYAENGQGKRQEEPVFLMTFWAIKLTTSPYFWCSCYVKNIHIFITLTPLSWGLFLAAGKKNCNGYIPFLSYRVILIRTSLGWPVQ